MKDRSYGIDAFRLLAAFCVISLHSGIYPTFNEDVVVQLRLISRWAVPFFFMISGYFLAQKHASPTRAAAPLARATLIFIFATLIMMPLRVYQQGVRGALAAVLSDGFMMNGSYYHLWFLSAMVVALLIILIVDQFEIRELLAPIAGLLALFFLSCTYFSISEEATNVARHLAGVPFIYLGMLMSHHRLSMRRSVVLVILGAALQSLEAHAISTMYHESAFGYQFLVGTIVLSIGVFGIAAAMPDRAGTRWLGILGARYALGIYIVHPYFTYFIRAHVSRDLQNTLAYDALITPVVFVLSLATLLAINRVAPILIDLIAADPRAVQRLNVFARRPA